MSDGLTALVNGYERANQFRLLAEQIERTGLVGPRGRGA